MRISATTASHAKAPRSLYHPSTSGGTFEGLPDQPAKMEKSGPRLLASRETRQCQRQVEPGRRCAFQVMEPDTAGLRGKFCCEEHMQEPVIAAKKSKTKK